MIKLPIELDDCGSELLLTFQNYATYQAEVKVQMVIKAPRGTLTLFHDEPRPAAFSNFRLSGTYTFPKQVKQCRAIKAFMKEHSND